MTADQFFIEAVEMYLACGHGYDAAIQNAIADCERAGL